MILFDFIKTVDVYERSFIAIFENERCLFIDTKRKIPYQYLIRDIKQIDFTEGRQTMPAGDTRLYVLKVVI